MKHKKTQTMTKKDEQLWQGEGQKLHRPEQEQEITCNKEQRLWQGKEHEQGKARAHTDLDINKMQETQRPGYETKSNKKSGYQRDSNSRKATLDSKH